MGSSGIIRVHGGERVLKAATHETNPEDPRERRERILVYLEKEEP